MAKSLESQPGNRNESKLARFYKGFNKISAVLFASVGIITGNEIFLAIAAFDVAQVYAVNRFQEWNKKRKNSPKGIGGTALLGAKSKPAHA